MVSIDVRLKKVDGHNRLKAIASVTIDDSFITVSRNLLIILEQRKMWRSGQLKKKNIP